MKQNQFILWGVGVLSVGLIFGLHFNSRLFRAVEEDAVNASSEQLCSALSQDNKITAREEVGEKSDAAAFMTAMKGAENVPQSEQASLWTAFSEARREIRPLTDHQKTMPENEGALYLASSPSQKMRARFLEDGVRLLSGYSGREWQGVLALADDSEVLEIRQEGTQIEYVRDGLIEWYHNNPEGLEHGYIVECKTSLLRQGCGGQADGQLIVPVEMDGLTVAAFDEGGLQFVNEAGEPVLSYSKLVAWDANGIELAAAMEPTASGLNILVADAGAAYPITIDPLIASLEDKLTASDAANDDKFGCSVSVSGDTALIGAYADYDNGSRSGSAYVFERSEGIWAEQSKLLPNDGEASDLFGYSVSISGDTALVGAYGNDDNGSLSGSAYVFERSGTNWSQQAKFTASDGLTWDYFGYSVSVSGDTALVGAYGDDDNDSSSGSAYVFERSDGVWSQEAKLTASDGDGDDYFGYAVSISGDSVLVGAYRHGNSGSGIAYGYGSAYVFVRSNGSWSQEAELMATDTACDDMFGGSVSLSGDRALIGAYGDSSSGSAYVFVRSGTSWSQQAKLLPDDGATRDHFGWSVCLSGDTALIGSKWDDDNGSGSGSAYVFERNGTNWNQQAKLTASDGGESDYFGYSVSISEDTVLVGAMGVDGEDKYDEDEGAVYIYRLFESSAEIEISGPSGSLSDGGCEILGNQAVGIGQAYIFSISSVGDVALTDLAISKDGVSVAAFDVEDLSVSNLTSGASTTFRVTYTPSSVGSHTAAVHIVSNDEDESPFDITLTGTGLANTDSDPGSDAWETANGFDPETDGDVYTLDSDGDGTTDIWEMYQGTDRYGIGEGLSMAVAAADGSSDGNGFSSVCVSNGVLLVQYRRSTTQTAVSAQGVWLPELSGSNWLYSGESCGGAAVTVTDSVVSNGVGFEIIESSAEVTSGSTNSLFFTLELLPNE